MAITNTNNEGVVGSLADFGNDVATLAELQAKLALLDTRETLHRATWPVLGIVIALTIGVGTIPVGLIGIAYVMAVQWVWPLGTSLLVIAGLVLGIAAVLGLVSYSKLTHSFTSFRRTSEELGRNLSWIRTVVVYSGRNFGLNKR